MGLWSSTFGGGNSFKESVANTFTPSDGAKYEKGNLVHDGGSNSGKSFTPNTVSHTGDTISGSANTKTNDGTVSSDGTVTAKPKGAAPNKLGVKDALGFAINPFSAIPAVLNGVASWTNGLNPEEDGGQNIGGRMVYTKKDDPNFKYSYNSLNMAYQVEVGKDDTVIDYLTIEQDANGNRVGSRDFDPSTAMTGYQRSQQQMQNSGDNEGARQLTQYQQDNQDTDNGSSGDSVLEMAKKAGLIKIQADMDAILADPNKFLSDRGLKVADIVPLIDGDTDGVTLDADNAAYSLSGEGGYTANTTGDAATVDASVNTGADTYTSELSNLTSNEMVNAATGTVSDDATVNAENYSIDTTGASSGINEDGTVSVLGNALNDFASQNISKVIDTSTVSGKLLAQKLGEGNYTDSKATVLGQMKLISDEFKSASGDPIIPSWAQSMHRDASKSIAFSGISGTAATAAFSNAIMEATLGVAESDAGFFRTLTTMNLDNRQQSVINKANVLSKLELANMDVRSQAAVMNAKNFMEMDMANLTNEQQAEIVNKQAFVQALFDNTKEINANRLFTAETNNDRDTFYSELNAGIQRHNSSEMNALKQFNAGEMNAASEFSADMKNAREQFVSTMQYNIDVGNAKWRQTVETTNTAIMAEAHTADVKAALDLTQEVQNNIWDSADNLLDYIWKSSDNDQDREARLLMAQMQAQAGQSSGGGFFDGLLQLGGAFLGSSGGSNWMASLLAGGK